MDVTFTKLSGRRYSIRVHRAVGPELAERNGPGYDPYLPHDVVHFVVEAEAGIRGGVFGQLARGDCGIFWPADQREIRRQARRRRRPTPDERADMVRSEWLATACTRAGGGHPPDETTDQAVMDRIRLRLDSVGSRWHGLPVGGSMTLTWPYAEGRRPAPANARRRRT